MMKQALTSVIALGVVIGVWSSAASADQEQGGIRVFKKGEPLPSLPAGLSTDLPVRSKFGFKIVEVDGKHYWEAATEVDYRASEAQRLGITPEKVSLRNCYQTGPTSCEGGCGIADPPFCRLIYNPASKHYYCACAE